MENDNNLLEIIQLRLRNYIPFISTFLTIFISTLPIDIYNVSFIKPSLGIICIFYWAAYRPDLLSYLQTFILGLFQDLINGTPLGVSSFIFLLAYEIVSSNHRFLHEKPFALSWAVFGVIAFFVYAIKFLFLGFAYSSFLPFLEVFCNYILLILIFPFIYYICALLQRFALKEDI